MNFDDISTEKEKHDGNGHQIELLKITEKRQSSILQNFPFFVKLTSVLSILGFICTSILQWSTGDFPLKRIGLITLQNPSLGSIIAFILTFFALIMIWLFVVWSLTLIPYIAYRAHKVSTIVPLPIATKSFRWLQLYASTFVPMTIFAVAWSSIPESNNQSAYIQTLLDSGYVVGGGIVIYFILWLITKVIPIRFITIHLAFLSTLLYISLFISYGYGYGLLSYSTLFGILFYLAFGFSKFEEIGRIISTYDLDPKVAQKINETALEFQMLRLQKDEYEINKMRMSARKEKLKNDSELNKINADEIISTQLNDIGKTRVEFNSNVNKTTLSVFHKKAELLKNMYDILSKEYDKRINDHVPQKIRELQENSKNYSPTEIQEKMNEIYQEMNKTLDKIPESLEALKIQMDEAVKQISHHTKRMSEDQEN